MITAITGEIGAGKTEFAARMIAKYSGKWKRWTNFPIHMQEAEMIPFRAEDLPKDTVYFYDDAETMNRVEDDTLTRLAQLRHNGPNLFVISTDVPSWITPYLTGTWTVSRFMGPVSRALYTDQITSIGKPSRQIYFNRAHWRKFIDPLHASSPE